MNNGGADGFNHGITGGIGVGFSEYKGDSEVVEEEKIKCDDPNDINDDDDGGKNYCSF